MARLRDAYTRYPRPILWLIQGGEVTIGGTEAESSPPFVAEVESFYLSKFPVSNEQFEAFAPGYERSPNSLGDRDPAVGVSWHEASEYCAWYAEVSRKPMRLPTEIEWEHACRGGTDGPTFVPEDEDPGLYLWHAGNCGGRVPRLDANKANPNGLWGMLGGVWEWTASVHRPYPLDAASEETAESRRILRGGSFRSPIGALTSSLRRSEDPALRRGDIGFRIAKSLR